MQNLVLSPIDPEVLIRSISEEVSKKIINNLNNSERKISSFNEWMDLDKLIEYDPEKRKKPTWYAKVSKDEVPHYKRGKKLYFLKSEIDAWLASGKQRTNADIDAEVDEFLSNKKRAK